MSQRNTFKMLNKRSGLSVKVHKYHAHGSRQGSRRLFSIVVSLRCRRRRRRLFLSRTHVAAVELQVIINLATARLKRFLPKILT